MEQLQQPKVARNLAQRNDGAAVKSFKGFVSDRRKIEVRQTAPSGENAHHRSHNLRKGGVRRKEASQPSAVRPACGLVKSAVGSETAAENIRKGLPLASARRLVVRVVHVAFSMALSVYKASPKTRPSCLLSRLTLPPLYPFA